jgi:hypothetical protein
MALEYGAMIGPFWGFKIISLPFQIFCFIAEILAIASEIP